MNVEALELLETGGASDAAAVRDAAAAGEHVDHEAVMPGWIARVRAGDQLAARALVERLRPGVLRIVRARRPRRMAEEDLMQEVFMKMFARLGQYQGSAPFAHWVSRIAVTTCLDHWRAQQRRPELRWADLAEWETDALDERADERSARTAGEALATRELARQLLDRLNAEDRLVVVMFELEERSIAEICDATGWGFEFAKMRLYRARKKMARMFEAMPGFDGAERRREAA